MEISEKDSRPVETPLLDKLREDVRSFESRRPLFTIRECLSDCTLQELIDVIEAKFEGIKASNIQIESQYDESGFEIVYFRKVTNEEWEARLVREKAAREANTASNKRYRKEQYLKLKEEFEGE